jgi:hypothetical protein
MPAARYWRIYVDRIPGDVVSGSEVQMRIATGGADQTTNTASRASQSSTYASDTSSYGAPNAFNNVNTDLFAMADAVGWLQYDFGAGNDKDIIEVTWRSRADGNPEQSPTIGRIAYSTDGVTFTEYWRFKWPQFTAAAQTRTTTRPTFSTDAATTARYWALFDDTNRANRNASFAEIEMRASIGGADQCNGGTPFANGGTPAAAFDNNNATYWVDTQYSLYAGHIGYDFGSGNPKAVVEVSMRGQPDYEDYAFNKGGVYASANGVDFLRMWGFDLPIFSNALPVQTTSRSGGVAPAARRRLSGMVG